MAWNTVPAIITSGQSVRWYFRWGSDPGFQQFRVRTYHYLLYCNPAFPPGGAELKMSDISFEYRMCEHYTYYLTVTHMGGLSPTYYVIEGKSV